MTANSEDIEKSEKIIKCLQALFPNKKIEELPYNDITNRKKNPRHPFSHQFQIYLDQVCNLYFPPRIWQDFETEYGIDLLLRSNNVMDRFNAGETEIHLETGQSRG